MLQPTAANHEGARDVAVRIISAFSLPFAVAGVNHTFGASIGISLYPGDDSDAETLFRQADSALYAAERKVGSRMQFVA